MLSLCLYQQLNTNSPRFKKNRGGPAHPIAGAFNQTPKKPSLQEPRLSLFGENPDRLRRRIAKPLPKPPRARATRLPECPRVSRQVAPFGSPTIAATKVATREKNLQVQLPTLPGPPNLPIQINQREKGVWTPDCSPLLSYPTMFFFQTFGLCETDQAPKLGFFTERW